MIYGIIQLIGLVGIAYGMILIDQWAWTKWPIHRDRE